MAVTQRAPTVMGSAAASSIAELNTTSTTEVWRLLARLPRRGW